MLSKHLQLEQFTNELDQTETLTLGFLSGVVLLRVEGDLLIFAVCLCLVVRGLDSPIVHGLRRSGGSVPALTLASEALRRVRSALRLLRRVGCSGSHNGR